MAFASDSTTAPARPLLPARDARGRFVRLASVYKFGDTPALPPEPLLAEEGVLSSEQPPMGVLTSEDTPEAIRADLDALLLDHARHSDRKDTSDVRHGGAGCCDIATSSAPHHEAPVCATVAQTPAEPDTVEAIRVDFAASPTNCPGNSGLVDQVGSSDVVTPHGGAPTLPHRDSLAAIRWELDGLLANVPALAPITPPASLERATTLWRRQALEKAVEHGAAVLDALGLPRLVDSEFTGLDPAAAGDALDSAIAALDELDGDPDAEPWLGWTGAALGRAEMGDTLDRENEPEHDEDDGTHEPSLASPERYPEVPCFALGGVYTARGGSEGQLRWAEGAHHDGEAVNEDGDDLEAGEHDTADMEPSLGWPEDVEAVLTDALQADHDLEADSADDEPEVPATFSWVFGPSRGEVSHA